MGEASITVGETTMQVRHWDKAPVRHYPVIERSDFVEDDSSSGE